jgi:hypothetical protein
VLDVTLISERTYKLNLITFLTGFFGVLSACQDTGQTTPVILAIDPWDCSSLPCLPHLSPVSGWHFCHSFLGHLEIGLST